MESIAKTASKKRKYLPADFTIENWESLKPYFENLLERETPDLPAYERWLTDCSELGAAVSEDQAWRYIRMTCDTANPERVQAFQFFSQEIMPHLSVYGNLIEKKSIASPFAEELSKKEGYDLMFKRMRNSLEIFREENIPLQTEIQMLEQEYGILCGAMTVQLDGKELTMQQAGSLLESTDRELREKVFMLTSERRAEDAQKLEDLFSKMLKLRHQCALNVGLPNYRELRYRELGRFDYTPDDALEFCESIRKEAVPLLRQVVGKTKTKLGLDNFRPWDAKATPAGQIPLKPFEGGADLLDKTIKCFGLLDPFFGECIATMKEMNHLDLESRKGKAPGGYNYPLMETGVPFIFMNATSSMRDLITMVHEGGHAVHSFLNKDMRLTDFKTLTPEIAEIASMAMELMSSEHWDVFFDKAEDIKRAKKAHLEDIVSTLPWVATVASFQHWIYKNPDHTQAERSAKWVETLEAYGSGHTDWSGLERFKEIAWHKQLHIFEVPFYYIEYAFAQLGAVAIWKLFKEDKAEAIKGYKRALSLGYTRSIPRIYEAAGIRFDFSAAYIGSLIAFLKNELEKLD